MILPELLYGNFLRPRGMPPRWFQDAQSKVDATATVINIEFSVPEDMDLILLNAWIRASAGATQTCTALKFLMIRYSEDMNIHWANAGDGVGTASVHFPVVNEIYIPRSTRVITEGVFSGFVNANTIVYNVIGFLIPPMDI